ncbi:MAG: UDP-N-acetylmuramate--L-alanine ligase [Planctomycetota bacterium]
MSGLGQEDRNATAAVHFVGIGGIGMSGLALYVSDRGWTVSGSDLVDSAEVQRLRNAGVDVAFGHDTQHLPQDVDFVVRSAAVPDENPEVLAARERGLPVETYARALGALTAHRATAAVAGTHGKTTTAAMLALILDRAGLEPGAVIGGAVPQIGGSVLYGTGAPFVAEACEYAESFLDLEPRHAIMVNIDADHLEYYGSMDRLRAAFSAFAAKLNADGLIVTTTEVAMALDLRRTARARVLTLGSSKCDVRLIEEAGGFRLLHPDGQSSGWLPAPLPGRHNLINAALAAVMAKKGYSVDHCQIKAAFGEFRGVERRFERLVDTDALTLIDDYAHHPTEVEATLLAARECYPNRRLVAIFQPHLEDRTRRHFAGFLNSLALADEVVVLRDYLVQGRDQGEGQGARKLTEVLKTLDVDCFYAGDRNEAIEHLLPRQIRSQSEVWVVMGAGDIRELSRDLHARLR